MTAPANEDCMAPSTLQLVKQVQYKSFMQLEAAFEPLGITAVQFRLLTTIASQPGLCSADLARIYDVKPQSMIRQIGLLEDRKLIARNSSKANKRLLVLELTDDGNTCLAECQRAAVALERELTRQLSANQREGLRGALQILLATLAVSGGTAENGEFSEEYRRAGVQRF